MKIIGAVLICFSSAIIGFRVSNAERTRYRTLCGIVFALDFMIAEISCLLTSAKDLFEKLSVQAPNPIKQFFSQCSLLMETRTDTPVTQIWMETAETADYLCLKEQELLILKEIGSIFGRYHAEEQGTLLKGIRMQAESLKETAKEDQSRNIRVYRSLGITCGIALAILLI